MNVCFHGQGGYDVELCKTADVLVSNEVRSCNYWDVARALSTDAGDRLQLPATPRNSDNCGAGRSPPFEAEIETGPKTVSESIGFPIMVNEYLRGHCHY